MHISLGFMWLNIEYPSCTLIEPIPPTICMLNLSYANDQWTWIYVTLFWSTNHSPIPTHIYTLIEKAAMQFVS